MVVAALSSSPAQAQTSFVPFDAFVQSVKNADTNEFLARPASKVTGAASFEEMRQHILNMYQGVRVNHSYVLDSQTFDCVPIDQQPSVRMLGLSTIPSEPPTSTAAPPGDGDDSAVPAALSQLPPGKTTDEFGNPLGCEAHTIPLRRITLEQVSGFETLRNFFEKGPNGAGHPDASAPLVPPSGTGHKYAYAYQFVHNYGPSATINLWRPYVYTDVGEVFTIAQLWALGGNGSATQSVEAGWQNYPAFWGTQNSVLFIYWTADNYNSTGCYNESCPGFVQTSSSLHLGAPFASYSIFDGAQQDIQLQYDLFYSSNTGTWNWWLGVGGTWMGYYPVSIFKGGQLSQYSTELEFGSEAYGTNVWPSEGSTLWPASGSTYAAYQRQLYYLNAKGVSVWASLTAVTPSPKCYKASAPAHSSSSYWGVHFYFGGPGGASCE